jgi:hypothetical protein
MSSMNKYKILIIILVLIGIGSPLTFSQKVATTSMQFLKVMPCSRGAALGDAYTTLASGAEAYFWNPAGMVNAKGQEVSITYTSWIMDSKIGALSYTLPVSNIGTFGAGIQYVDYGSMDEAIWASPWMDQETNPGLTGKTFRPFAMIGGISYAKQLTDKFSMGISAKFAYESLYDGHSAYTMTSQGVYENVKTWGKGLLFDFGMHYNTGYKTIQVAISAQNFGADVKYAKDDNPVPLQFRWGISADLLGNNALLMENEKNRITMAFDLFQPNDYAQQEHLGLEYSFDNTVSLRAGYKFNYDSEGLTLGAGVKTTLNGVGLSFDYCYSSLSNYLGDVHRISLGASL